MKIDPISGLAAKSSEIQKTDRINKTNETKQAN